jgi:hypothetical protein
MPALINQWNAEHRDALACMLYAVMWETHAAPSLAAPAQWLINKRLVQKADILVATFKGRIGSATSRHRSGTIEEIEEFRAAGKPVLVYFSEIAISPYENEPAELAEVKKYKDELMKQGVISTYKTIEEFRKQVSQHLTQTIQDCFRANDV